MECCWRIRERDAQTWVLWVHASNGTRFRQSCHDIADRLRLPGRQEQATDIVRLVTNWLHDERRTWVLVLDNVDDDGFLYETRTIPGQSTELVPIVSMLSDTNGSIVLTTRDKRVALRFADSKNVFQIDTMTEDQALALLQKKLGVTEQTEYLINLAKVLEGMPLAIVQAAAYITHQGSRCSVSQYLEKIQTSGNRLLEYEAGHQYRDWEAKNSIIVTWSLSFDHIRKRYPAAACLLSLMTFFDRNTIPEKLIRHRPSTGKTGESELKGLTKVAEDVKNAWTSGMAAVAQASKTRPPFWPKQLQWKQPAPLKAFNKDDVELESDAFVDNFEESLLILRDHSLVSTTSDPKVFVMHALVQLATTKWLESHKRLGYWRQRFLVILLEWFPDSERKNWDLAQELLPHLQYTSSQRPEREDIRKKWALLLARGATFAYQTGDGAAMMQMSLQSKLVFEETLGPEHLETLSSASLLATAYDLCGQPIEAHNLQTQLDHTCRKLIDAHYCQMLSFLGKELLKSFFIPSFLAGNKKLLEVEETRRYFLTGFPLSITSRSMHLANTGRLREAEMTERIALRFREKGFGPGSSLTMASKFALSSIYNYRDQFEAGQAGKAAKAIGLWQQGYEILQKRAFIPDVIKSFNQSMLIALNQDQLDEAGEQLALPIIQFCEHANYFWASQSADALNVVALIRQRQGNFYEAERFENLALDARSRFLGPFSFSSLLSMSLLAITYKDLGQLERAVAVQEAVLQANQRICGRGHPRTLAALNELVSTYWEQGRWQEAETIGVEVWVGYNRILASEDSDTRGVPPGHLNASIETALFGKIISEDRQVLPSIARLALSNSFANHQADTNTLLVDCLDLRAQNDIFEVPYFQLLCLLHRSENSI